MANTYTQIYLHVIFAVSGRRSLIRPEKKEELHKYITGIVRSQRQKLLAIHCMPDHTHILIGIRPDIALSDLVRDVKAHSSRFINERRWVRGKFGWQEGFGAFSHSHSQLDAVITYVRDQEKHHTRRSFQEEYREMLDRFKIVYDSKYLFEWVADE